MRTIQPASILLSALFLSDFSWGVQGDDKQTYALSSTVGVKCSSMGDCGYVPSLACIDGVCDYCAVDNDCDGYNVCQVESNGEGYCIEKDFFSPFTGNDVAATIIAFLSTALGSGCGVGGGGLLVPFFILLIGLPPKHAIPLSKATIFGNAVAIYIFNFNKKNPAKSHTPIIRYSVSALMEPTTLVGSVFGVMMNQIFPNWLVLLLLILLLAFTTYKTTLKGYKIRAKESKRRNDLMQLALKGAPNGGGPGRRWSVYRHFDAEVAARRWLAITRRNVRMRRIRAEDEEDFKHLPPLNLKAGGNDDAQNLLHRQSSSHFDYVAAPENVDVPSSDVNRIAAVREKLEKEERKRFPWKFMAPLILSWIIIFFQSLMRGGHGSDSIVGIQCNSVGYWLLTIIPLFFLFGIAGGVGYYLRLRNRLRVVTGYPFADGDIHWIRRRAYIFPTLCTIAGVAAGLLGIGGGMVKGPIMLEMGIMPAVQSVTASFMILFTASSTTLQFLISGQFPGVKQYDYVLWFIFVGFLGGLAGQKVVGYLVKKYKRESIMVFILAIAIGLSGIAMGVISIISTVNDIKKGINLGFNDLCH